MVNCHANLRRQSLLWRLPLDAVIFSPFEAICLFYAASQNQTDHETNSQLAPSGQFNTKYLKKKYICLRLLCATLDRFEGYIFSSSDL